MEFIEILGLAGLTIFIYMTVLYGVSMKLKNASIVDIGWGLGFILVSFVVMFINVSFVPRSFLVMALVALWGFRLAGHVFLRNRGKSEDWRYAAWRKDWGKSFWWRSYVQVFFLQGVLMLLVSIPVLFVHYASREEGLTWFDITGAIVWFVGFAFETIADYQLAEFKAKPVNKGRIMKSGLWAYSRHPNYFGEVLGWWGVFLIVLALPGALFTIIGPALITYLIIFVSGVPLLEKKYKGNKEFEMYKQSTSILFPWFPKKTMTQRVG